MGFLSPKTPAYTPPPPLPAPPPPPQLPDAISARNQKAGFDGARGGVASTIQTGPKGLDTKATTATKSLLGQ